MRILVVAILTLILSIVCFCGKGSPFIAGYYLLSKNKREKLRNNKVVSRLLGCFLLFDSLLLFANYILLAMGLSSSSQFLTVSVLLIVMNTFVFITILAVYINRLFDKNVITTHTENDMK